MYQVIILLTTAFEKGVNPSFLFKDKKEAFDFAELCMENNYSVEMLKENE